MIDLMDNIALYAWYIVFAFIGLFFFGRFGWWAILIGLIIGSIAITILALLIGG